MITVGIPSRNRLDSLRRCINSIAATIGCEFRICVAFGDDALSYRYLPPYPYVEKINFSPREYYVRDVNRLYKFMKETAPDDTPLDYFVITQDDCEFVQPGWGPMIINALHNNFPEGQGVLELFCVNCFGDFASRAAFFDDNFDGQLLPEAYQHFFSDSDRRQEVSDMGRYRYVDCGSPKNAIIRHVVYSTTDTMSLDNRDLWYEQDKQTFKRRQEERESNKRAAGGRSV